MDLDEAREFLRSNHRAVMATTRRDGTPQMSPITVSADADGFVIVSSRETAMKVKNLRRDPRAWICVFVDSFYGGPFVQVGPGELGRLARELLLVPVRLAARPGQAGQVHAGGPGRAGDQHVPDPPSVGQHLGQQRHQG